MSSLVYVFGWYSEQHYFTITNNWLSGIFLTAIAFFAESKQMMVPSRAVPMPMSGLPVINKPLQF